MTSNIEKILDQGINYHHGAEFVKAEQCYRQVLALDNTNIDALHLLGVLDYQQGKYSSALQLIQEALQFNPENPDAISNLGLVYEAQNLRDLAQKQYEKALSLNAQCEQALCNLGGIYLADYQLQRAKTLFEKAYTINPNSVELLTNLGKLYHDEGNIARAYDYLSRALQIAPEYVNALNNLGNVYLDQGQLEQALIYFDRAINNDAGFAKAHYNKSLVLLRMGEFKQGWREYEYRVQVHSGRDYLLDPSDKETVLLRPSSYSPLNINGKHFLFLSDQGIGDELFFLRFIPQLKAKGGRVSYRCSPKLVNVLSRLSCLDAVGTEVENFDQADYIMSVCELPLLCNMESTEDIPSALELVPDAEILDNLSEQLKNYPKPWLGITWRSGTPYCQKSLYKEAPLGPVIKLMKSVPATWVIMQREPDKHELNNILQEVGYQRVLDLSQCNEDLEQAFAAMCLLDDYIGVSNTNNHLRAAAKKSARVLVPLKSEFRWMEDCKSSPWFPEFELYRESSISKWDDAMARLERDLIAAYGIIDSNKPS